ncbi:hypothetical protein [Microbacterium album]|uniref:hypothetical protein n=1 Tax=Microbacterium album TaxID=2053191 RepID=UPI0016643BB1|nr:hypothetical protein [Microbacterium album]
MSAAALAASALLALTACAPSDAEGTVSAIADVPGVAAAFAEYQQPGLPTNVQLVVTVSVPDAESLDDDSLRDIVDDVLGTAWRSAETRPEGISVWVTPEPLPDSGRPDTVRLGGERWGGYTAAELEERFGAWEQPR